ncbi:MAG: sigma 54-interacting transcriptional regulator [Candidatus Binatia bacterium]
MRTDAKEHGDAVRKESEDQFRRMIDTIPTLASWSCRPDGATAFLNQRWLDYTGLSAEDTQGFGWLAAFHPQDLAAHQDNWHRAVAAGEAFEHEARLQRADGAYRWFLHRGVPWRDDAGHITQWYGTSTDIEDRKQVEQVRTEQARQAAVRADVSAAFSKPADLREILRGCAEAIVRHVGAAFARLWTPTEDGDMLELQASAGLYTHLDGLHSRIPVGQLKIGLIAAERKPHLTNDVTNDAQVTDQVWARSEGMVAFAGYPLIVEGRLIGVMAMFARERLSAATLDTLGSVADLIAQGIERKHAEEKLRRSEANLLEAQRLSRTGSWTHDVSSGTVTTSPEALRIFGVKPDEDPSTAEFFFTRIHSEDRPLEVRNYERARLAKASFESEYRIVLPDGSIKHVHNIGHPIVNEAGELLKFVGTTMDVTEQHHSRVELEKAFEEIQHLKDRLHDENLVLREELDQASMFEEIVGSSEALRKVLRQVAKVAPVESTVLILGETGTGKELIARAIHKRSNRATRAFIRVNCAAIPPALIASELFGHEKGAFTGALQRRLGRFEAAQDGTIFLDEIGDLPMETQIALLRVLQEREFERVGSSQPIAVDVRVLAATNRDLKAAVATGTFRQDLFYRLNVFPIQIPSLRERVDDIPLLVEYLIERYAKKAGKKIRNIPKTTLEQFQAYDWPGNIRELQNVIERAVVLCESDTFSIDETWLTRESPQPSGPAVPLATTLVEHEREIIEAALAACQGRISGPSGAAAKLGIPRQTLDSKIKNLGIDKHRFKVRRTD